MSTPNEARDIVLKNIRTALGSTHQISPESEFAAIQRTYQQTGILDADARRKMFIERLHEYDAHVAETSTAELGATIASILQLRKQSGVVVADGYPNQALPEGFNFRWESEVDIEQLGRADGIITRCFAAIAFTGSIVLRHGPGEGARKFTLLPDRHLCVVREDQLVETVPEAFAQLAPYATSPITFISGPSATADIEMTRIRGVHGPRFLDVVFVRN
jgi:L-lactate dehydrogenase complex protein LldG